ncbi:MAG TPA: hypothetical protein VIL44_03245 [Micromonospora sp.]
MTESYPELLWQLADLATRIAHARAEAEAWHAERCAAAHAAVAEAEAAIRAAQAEVDAARAELDAVDREAADLWEELVELLGPAASRHGGLPLPSPDPEAAGTDPQPWLASTRNLLDRVRKLAPLPRSVYPVLVLFGVLGAGIAVGLATAARAIGARYGGDLAIGLPVVALVITLLGPFTGLAPAKALADRQHAALDLRTAAVVIGAGLATTAVAAGLWR